MEENSNQGRPALVRVHNHYPTWLHKHRILGGALKFASSQNVPSENLVLDLTARFTSLTLKAVHSLCRIFEKPRNAHTRAHTHTNNLNTHLL